MNDGYLNNFFGADKQKTVDIKQWRDQQIFPQNLTYPTDNTLPKTRKLLYDQYMRARNEEEMYTSVVRESDKFK